MRIHGVRNQELREESCVIPILSDVIMMDADGSAHYLDNSECSVRCFSSGSAEQNEISTGADRVQVDATERVQS